MRGGDLRRLIEESGFPAPRTALDQHFLISERVHKAILDACAGMCGFLEIGPGPGVLTKFLCEMGTVIAIDVDPRSKEALARVAPAAEFVLGDITQIDLQELAKSLPEPRALVGNLPYSVTGAILEATVHLAPLIHRAVLMMQREVAERVAAPPGDRRRGAISVLCAYAYAIERVVDAPPSAFVPPPEVSSQVLRFESRGGAPSTALARLVRAAFRHPRKTLANNLRQADIAPDVVRSVLGDLGLPTSVRPHQVKEADWLSLLDHLEPYLG
jgi:16S rRNA (adenine1518-N6/adenine1519-N6)-dimethyltransferase